MSAVADHAAREIKHGVRRRPAHTLVNNVRVVSPRPEESARNTRVAGTYIGAADPPRKKPYPPQFARQPRIVDAGS